jgi:hypothetical protein
MLGLRRGAATFRRQISGSPQLLATDRKAIFDRELKWKQKEQLARIPGHQDYQYLHSEVASRLLDRLVDIKMDSFSKIVDLGSHLSTEHLSSLQQRTPNKILQLSPCCRFLLHPPLALSSPSALQMSASKL